MKILFVVPYVPSLIRVRSYQWLRGLARRGNQVTLAALWNTDEDRQAALELQEVCESVELFHLPRWRSLLNCVQVLPSRQPLQAAYAWHSGMARSLSRLIAAARPGFDIVHVEHLRGARVGLALAASSSHRPPVVWDSVDSISHLFRQAAARNPRRWMRALMKLELARTEAYEAQLPARFDRVLVTSQADRAAFEHLPGYVQPPAPIAVLPNGVDLDYFCPDPAVEREPDTLVISGKMSYHANVDMVLRLIHSIMPLVWQERPQVKVWVVGKDPSPALTGLAADPRINVTGTVPDLRPYLYRAAVAVAPLGYGAGVQNKVLEAMACGTPVVTSEIAAAPLAVRSGSEIMVAAGAAEFAAHILNLLADPEACRRMSTAARRYVEDQHNWDHLAARLEAEYQAAGEMTDRIRA